MLLHYDHFTPWHLQILVSHTLIFITFSYYQFTSIKRQSPTLNHYNLSLTSIYCCKWFRTWILYSNWMCCIIKRPIYVSDIIIGDIRRIGNWVVSMLFRQKWEFILMVQLIMIWVPFELFEALERLTNMIFGNRKCSDVEKHDGWSHQWNSNPILLSFKDKFKSFYIV